MKDNFNDIWEAMLKAAVLENSYNLVQRCLNNNE